MIQATLLIFEKNESKPASVARRRVATSSRALIAAARITRAEAGDRRTLVMSAQPSSTGMFMSLSMMSNVPRASCARAAAALSLAVAVAP